MNYCLIPLVLICTNTYINPQNNDKIENEQVVIRQATLFESEKQTEEKGYKTLLTPWMKIEKAN